MSANLNHVLLFSLFPGKINRYYEYIWARYGGVNEAEVLGNLPKSLRAAVANHVLGPLLKKVPFFECCSEPMEQVHSGLILAVITPYQRFMFALFVSFC